MADLTPRQERIIELATHWDVRRIPMALWPYLDAAIGADGSPGVTPFELSELIRTIGPCLERQNDAVIPAATTFGPAVLDLDS